MNPLTQAFFWQKCFEMLKLSRVEYPGFMGTVRHMMAIRDRYNELGRYYHNLDHIVDGFKKFALVHQYLERPLVIWWTWLRHDEIYVPTADSGMNENRTALLVERDLHSMGMPARDVNIVTTGIRATADHLVPRHAHNANDLAIMLDVDLSGFGAPRAEFGRQGQLLRKEYTLDTTARFNKRTADFCTTLLNRKSVFQSTPFKRFEAQAQKNLRWAIAQATS